MKRRVGLEEISISGVWLHKRGKDVIVEVERMMADGTFRWFEIISEPSDGEFSHIVEPEKIRAIFWRKPEGQVSLKRTEMDDIRLKQAMAKEVRGVIGGGFVDEYYRQIASGFVQIAQGFIDEALQRRDKITRRRK